MGNSYNGRKVTPKDLLVLPPPIILCISRGDYDKVIQEAGYMSYSLNLPLAKSLIGKEAQEIPIAISDIIKRLIPEKENILLVNYEMLFDPRYKLDVMRLFIEISRQNKLIVKWCGTVAEDTLVYSEQGYADNNRYQIGDYDITVVK